MTADQIQAHLDRWRDAMRPIDCRLESLAREVGCSPESPLLTAIHELQDAMTEQLACLIGWDVWAEVLTDWHLVHDFGETPMRISFNDEPLRSLSSNEELVAFIAEDLARVNP